MAKTNGILALQNNKMNSDNHLSPDSKSHSTFGADSHHDTFRPAVQQDKEQIIELAQEEISVSKKVITETRQFSKTVVADEVTIPIELTSEDIIIERFPKNEELESVPQIQNLEDKTIIPVFEERAVVVKKLFLVEEIHITKKYNSEVFEVKETLRKEVFNETPESGTTI